MARDQRLNIPGGSYHVMNRGNRKVLIFEDEHDRRMFLRILIQATAEYHVRILGGTQMGTHFHLVLLTPHGNLSEFMQQLEGRFAQYSNWRHGRVGHLFQDRFKGVTIANDTHLFTALWYVFTNPVVASFVRRPEDWKWSTYAATAGFTSVPNYLSIEWLETLFPAGTLKDSQQLFRRCMSDPRPIRAYLEAVEPTTAPAIQSFVVERLHELAQPCSYRTLMRPPLSQLFPAGQDRTERKRAIALAHGTHGFKLAEIARCIHLHPATVSKLYCSLRSEKER